MTQHFQIITKREGESYRLIADIILQTYSEDELAQIKQQKRQQFDTGTVRIWHVPAVDKKSHGTEVILMDLREQARALLQSRERWAGNSLDEDRLASQARQNAPKYHIGRVSPEAPDTVEEAPALPWEPKDSPREKFEKLVQAVIDEVGEGTKNPKLEFVLDNYLQTLWTLSLSAPLDYIDKHPFDLTAKDGIRAYHLSNEAGGQVKEIRLHGKKAIRDMLELKAPQRGRASSFAVFVDDIQLLRPIRYTNLPATGHALKTPLIFVGKHRFNLGRVSQQIRGGSTLAFEGYLFWTPKVIPTEHIGILIRIGDSNGTLFDETFMKYQVSEQTRLKQVTAEIYVHDGLDAALNIDRESFNYAHPHYQVLTRWVHNAFRQFATKQKALAKDIREEQRSKSMVSEVVGLSKVIQEELESVLHGDISDLPEVLLLENGAELFAEKRKEGALAFDQNVVLSGRLPGARRNPKEKKRQLVFRMKMEGLIRLLDAYGLFEEMPYNQQQELVRAIGRLFATGDEE